MSEIDLVVLEKFTDEQMDNVQQVIQKVQLSFQLGWVTTQKFPKINCLKSPVVLHFFCVNYFYEYQI